MASRRNYNRYQYETSPRKLKPEYNPIKKEPYKNKRSTAKKEKPKQVEEAKSIKLKAIVYLIIGFSVLLAISYRNTKIDENFAKLQELKADLALVQKENEQLQIEIENNLNLSNIEQSAKEKLGMQKLDNNQKVYVSLPKKDYVETASEKVIIEEEENIFQRILKMFKNIF